LEGRDKKNLISDDSLPMACCLQGQCSLHQEVMAQRAMTSSKTLKLGVYFVTCWYKIRHCLSEQN